MATAREYAQWIVANRALSGTPEFAIVAQAYELAKQMEAEIPEPIAAPPPTIGERILGAGETGATLVTGMVAAPVAAFAGGARQLASNVIQGRVTTQDVNDSVELAAARAASGVIYQPRTPAGQEMVGAVGEALEAAKLPPFMPIGGPAGVVAPAVQGAVRRAETAVQPAVEAAGRVAGRARELLPGATARAPETAVVPPAGGVPPPGAPGAPTFGGAVGAAGVEIPTLRAQQAAALPVPVALTKGQRERTFEQQRFEQEIAKNPELGAPIRERLGQQQQQVAQNLEAFIDATGAEMRDVRGVGQEVVRVLRKDLAEEKRRVRTLYQDARRAGETSELVSLAPLADYLNANRAGRTSAPILSTIAEELRVKEVGDGSLAEGSLVAGNATLDQVEEIRKSVNRFAKPNDPNDLRIADEIKSVIDTITAPAGGELYQRARRAREVMANRFENIGLVTNLINTKRNSNDRIIAYEDIINRAVISPSTSLDSVKHLMGLLKKTEAGRQAVKEIQGAVLQIIRDDAYKNIATNERGDRLISPAAFDRSLRNLDRSGKLEYIFNKRGAEQLRTLNDVVGVLFTAPPGTINTSNTASVLLQALDTMVTYGTTGLPVPAGQALKALTKQIKDRKIRQRVQEALQ